MLGLRPRIVKRTPVRARKKPRYERAFSASSQDFFVAGAGELVVYRPRYRANFNHAAHVFQSVPVTVLSTLTHVYPRIGSVMSLLLNHLIAGIASLEHTHPSGCDPARPRLR